MECRDIRYFADGPYATHLGYSSWSEMEEIYFREQDMYGFLLEGARQEYPHHDQNNGSEEAFWTSLIVKFNGIFP